MRIKFEKISDAEAGFVRTYYEERSPLVIARAGRVRGSCMAGEGNRSESIVVGVLRRSSSGREVRMSSSSTLSKADIPELAPLHPIPPRIPGSFAGGKIVEGKVRPKWADEVQVFIAVPVDEPTSVPVPPPPRPVPPEKSRKSSRSRENGRPRDFGPGSSKGRSEKNARPKSPPQQPRWSQIPTVPNEDAELPVEDVVGVRRIVISSGVSTIVHMLVLIVLGLMLADPLRREARELPMLEVSVVPELGDKDRSATTKIEVRKPPSVAAVQPQSGMPKALGAPSFVPGGGGGKPVGVVIGPPAILGGPGLDKGGDGKGNGEVAGPNVEGPLGPVDGNTANFFGLQALGQKIAFVVDTSGSMSGNERYLRCREELIESLKTLKPTQSYYVVFFSSKTYPMPQRRFVLAMPPNLRETIRWLEQRDPIGGTLPVPGIELALKQRPDAIYLLTDGSFDDGTPGLIHALQPNTKKRIPIHTIAFENQSGEDMLKEISASTGGKYRYVP